ncbi:hypothetical protein C8R47DRAFT_1203344 [Mycena vitilis]|nr:hypothetical protein C8R47DRAFT_1203344 [Mycena vitilis]
MSATEYTRLNPRVRPDMRAQSTLHGHDAALITAVARRLSVSHLRGDVGRNEGRAPPKPPPPACWLAVIMVDDTHVSAAAAWADCAPSLRASGRTGEQRRAAVVAALIARLRLAQPRGSKKGGVDQRERGIGRSKHVPRAFVDALSVRPMDERAGGVAQPSNRHGFPIWLAVSARHGTMPYALDAVEDDELASAGIAGKRYSRETLPCLSDTSGVTGDYSPMPASAPYITSRTSFHTSLADTMPPSVLSAQLAPSATSALLLARFYPT